MSNHPRDMAGLSIPAVMCVDRPAKFVRLALVASVVGCATAESAAQSPINIETLVQSTSAWDATPYTRYPDGPPGLSVLRFTSALHTTLEWRSRPIPNSGYVLAVQRT